MSRLDRYYIPPGVPARPPAPPLPRKGILMVPPPPLPPHQGKHQVILSPDGNWSYHGSFNPHQMPVDPRRRRPMMPRPVVPSAQKQQQPSGQLYEEVNRLHNGKQSVLPGRRMDSQNVTTAMSLPDTSPRLALQRILALYENGDYREAANFLRRISTQTFRQLLPQLPADVFIESMPHSLPILEALYAKIYSISGGGTVDGNSLLGKAEGLRPEAVVWQLVKFFANQDDGMVGQMRWEFCGPFISSCKRLLSVLLASEPRLKRLVSDRKRALAKAIEGLGQHGMVGTSDEQLMNLHSALKLEFEKAQKAYSEAIEKLETLRLNAKTSKATAPIAQSHQRQLSLKSNEIQERLIKNKTLLNVVEPTLENTSLEVLLGILQKRIELDKECLFQYTQIKKDAMHLLTVKMDGNKKTIGKASVDDQSVAPIFMRYQRGCQQVLDLFKELTSDNHSPLHDVLELVDDDDEANSTGYHSDSESCVMTSGNSPFISKEARYSFLSRSVRLGSKHSIRASILATSSLCLDSASLRSASGTIVNGPSSLSSMKTSSLVAGLNLAAAKASDNNRASNEVASAGNTANTANSNHGNHSSSSGVSSGSVTSGDEEKIDVEANGAKAATTSSTTSRPRHLKQLRSKGSHLLSSGALSSDECSLSEPLYQGIAETTTSTTTDISALRQEADLASLRKELSRCRLELAKAQKTVFALEDSERELREKLADEKHKTITLERMCGRTNNYGSLDCRGAELVRRYGDLYSQLRLETLDALDQMPQLVNSDELKNKLLFSVVVLAFRSITTSIESKRDQVRRVLQLPPPPTASADVKKDSLASDDVTPDPVSRELEEAITRYLRRATDNFDLSKNVEEVLSQIWATLYDYPCLKSCDGIVKYVKECVRVAWGLVNQSPSYVIEYETRHYKSDLHVRAYAANASNTLIQTYLWPALLEGDDGPCVQKGVVIT